MSNASAPFRAEIFSIERLEEYARTWAQQDQPWPPNRRGQGLLARLANNDRVLLAAQNRFSEAVRRGKPLSTSAEWLLDNFYVVQEQLREVTEDLSHNYYSELPKVANRYGNGYPRVYGIALELLTHTDSRLDAETIERFVKAYQTTAPLALGELWAVAIMLRVALVENLRRLVDDALDELEKREQAEAWVEQFRQSPGIWRSDPIATLAAKSKGGTALDPVFGVHLLQLLRDADPALLPAIRWLEHHLRAEGQHIEDVIRNEHLRRAANRVSVGNVITTMRTLALVDWPAFIENTSQVEQLLRTDPVGMYAQMNFETRDQYRHVIERIARRAGGRRPHPHEQPALERGTTERALSLARETEADPRRGHVGYYLVGRGHSRLEAEMRYRLPWRDRLSRVARARPLLLYSGLIVLVTTGLLAGALAYAASADAAPMQMLLIAVLGIIPASGLAVNLLNWTIALEIETVPLPKLDFRAGLKPEYRTMVVVPVLIHSASTIDHLLDKLEVRYLGNRDPFLHFALLGDFADANEQSRPEDAMLVEHAVQRINDLNGRYGDDKSDRFYFFNRRRLWNPEERSWMGWERKRGNLIEFNRLLRGATDTSYDVQIGDLSILPQVRFVITLDADTDLPLDSARRLVGTLAHPLNHPVLDPVTRRVIDGYAIIQPRTAVNATAASESPFARLFAGDTGLDPYSTAASDVYQDLFGAGIYVGKACYDVDAMRAALDGRFPQNLLLSHDLLESTFARTGLATDIQLLEDYPTGYDAYTQRAHRWIRGDWQITDWLFPWVRDESGQRVKNPLPLSERWKILDNLRRSLLPLTTVLLIVSGWILLPGSAIVWTLIALFPLVAPNLIGVAAEIGNHPPGETWRVYADVLLTENALGLKRGFCQVAFMLFEAVLSVDAIVRVFVRRVITHHRLLEWTSAALVEHGQARTAGDYLGRMWASPLLALLALGLTAALNPAALFAALPLGLLWLAAPALAWFISQPYPRQDMPLPAEAQRSLRITARKIWRFYETFAGESDHFLPPDNYQEEPVPIVAHRTSPTNIGFLLTSTIAAYDFGYIDLFGFAERAERTIATIESMHRFRGHLYNWYDTLSLNPLHPAYISTVDSGNLSASLVVLKQACLEMEAVTVLRARSWDGLQDIIASMEGSLTAQSEGRPVVAVIAKRMAALLQTLAAETREAARDRQSWLKALQVIEQMCAALDVQHDALTKVFTAANGGDIRYGIDSLRQFAAAQRKCIEALLPAWLHEDNDAVINLPTLRELACDPAQPQGNLADAQPCPCQAAEALLSRFRTLAEKAEALAAGMDFTFLFDEQRELFSIGFNVDAHQRDNSFYDLLASEARLASFLAIARGQIEARHWFRLGRPLTRTAGQIALLSWGGTMFEYLMPALYMRHYDHNLLAQTLAAVVRRQAEYGRQRGVPWGISESGYFAVDYQQNYQYRMFGVPDLGLRREQSDELVIAPYATLLALPFAPHAAWENLQRLAAEGATGPFGYYEAIDYTPSRRPSGERAGLVRSTMAHHAGMSFAALDNFLHDNCLQTRFHHESIVSATDLLLQEKLPRHAPIIQPHPEKTDWAEALPATLAAARTYTTAETRVPRTHLLSNGAYTVMVTNAGGGYSRYNTVNLTRWQADATRDALGTFIYLRDLRTGLLWSAAHQPLGRKPEHYEAVFALDNVHFLRRDHRIDTYTEIVVSPEDQIEVRRVHLVNNSRHERYIQVTSYAEIVLDSPQADAAHPAFGKLFVESEFVAERSALLFKRRTRSAGQSSLWGLHLLNAEGQALINIEYETDRARFLGRGKDARDPQSLTEPLSKTTGAVLDPVMSLRGTVHLAAGSRATLWFVSGMADSREQATRLIEEYHDPRAVERVFELSRAHSQLRLRHLGVSAEDSHLFQELASAVLYPDPLLRGAAHQLARNTRGQNALFSYGISGDYPIILVKVDDESSTGLVRQMLLAHEFLRLHGLNVDLVILNRHSATYSDGLQNSIQQLIDSSLSHPWVDKPGGIFLRRADHMPEEDRILLETVARVVLDGKTGTLADNIERANAAGASRGATEAQSTTEPSAAGDQPERRAQPLASYTSARERPHLRRFDWELNSSELRDARRRVISALRLRQESLPAARKEIGAPSTATQSALSGLSFFSGLGAFDTEKNEYVITLPTGASTPAPWINVLANEQFGCLVSETGLGYTWSINSQLNRLTPWSNDPVSDPPGEAIFLRDDGSGEVWSPTPLPAHGSAPYLVRHGAGYTQFEHSSHGLTHNLLITVPVAEPVKIMRLSLRNETNQMRNLTITSYNEWVLGITREQGQYFVVTEWDAARRILFARNTYNTGFSERTAFASIWLGDQPNNRTPVKFTADRTEFLGRNGTLQSPAALQLNALSGQVGSNLDPCSALQLQLRLQVGQTSEVIILLGQGRDKAEAATLVEKYRSASQAKAALAAVQSNWEAILGTIQVQTPDASMNLMLNRWLLYQALACRVWARSAFYQSGGAYGFRDQLQDVLALVFATPEQTRAQILRAAAHQFAEGDVLHWWHPGTFADAGIRTHFSDDYLWLPYAVECYTAATEDTGILDEIVPFLSGPELRSDQVDIYLQSPGSDENGTLYEHCVRALDRAIGRMGEHGLPLMGTGDWNDGMNNVGAGGKGESIWVGWFLTYNLRAFIDIARRHGDTTRVERYQAEADRLAGALAEHGWDGAWYRRAYFDDGTPLGSAQNDECRIDSIAQSWAIISGAAPAERATQALSSIDTMLVDERNRLIKLLTPAFDKGSLNPGYIKGYPPGIRENGGQYTHAALWVILAHARQGNGNRAAKLFALLNPINHTRTRSEVDRYKAEPYVIAADVYSHPQHLGRGGWTWYTGSAAWMYRVGVEAILGLQRQGDGLVIDPCIPTEWQQYELTYRFGKAVYHIRIENPEKISKGVVRVALDGAEQSGKRIPLQDDGGRHVVVVVMGGKKPE